MHKKIVLSILASGALLAANDINIGTITVTAASKTAQTLKNITSNVEVITAAEIEEKHYTTVTEALSSLSGISFAQNGGMGTTSSVFVQGLDTKYTLILIDGVKYNDLSSADGAAQLAHLLISDIERIEVIKGANPIWGADAAAGVINVVTKKAAKGFKSEVEAMGGSNNTRSFGSSFRYGADKLDLSASLSRYLTDGYSAQAPRGKSVKDYEKDGYQNTNANLKAGYDIAKNLRVEGEYFSTQGVSNYDGFNAPNAALRSKYDYSMYKAAVLATLDKHRISFQASSSASKKDELDETSPFNVKIFRGDIKNYEAKDSWDYAWFGNLTYGVAKEDIDIRYSKPTAAEVKKDDSTRAVFAANTLSHMGLTLSQALRYDDYSSFGSKTTGKLGAKYALNKDISLSTNYGSAFKTPTLTQMMNPWGTPNFDLKPEDIRSFDATVSYKRTSLTYFYNAVHNLINWQGGGYQNIGGTSKLQGYEAKTDAQISDDFVVGGTYTRLQANDGSGRELARRPHDTLSVKADWYPTAALHIGLSSSYIGTRYDTNTKAVQTGGYAVFNGVVNYRIDKNLSVYGKFDNLLDRYYQVVDGYATDGRSVYVGAKMVF